MPARPPIDRAVLQHVATLASLSLTDAEASRLTEEMATILAYVAELDAIDTSNVPATAQVQLAPGASLARAERADVVEAGLSNEDALSQAPRSSQGGFAVPGFMESEE